LDKSITIDNLSDCLERLSQQHDSLRLSYQKTPKGWKQQYSSTSIDLQSQDLSSLTEDELKDNILHYSSITQQSLDIEKGEIAKALWMQMPEKQPMNRLLLTVHHLAIDGVSWRILLEDLGQMLEASKSGTRLELSAKSSSYRQWYQTLKQYGEREQTKSQLGYWQRISKSYKPLAKDKQTTSKATVNDSGYYRNRLTEQLTQKLSKTKFKGLQYRDQRFVTGSLGVKPLPVDQTLRDNHRLGRPWKRGIGFSKQTQAAR
jgi:hypothetical protein